MIICDSFLSSVKFSVISVLQNDAACCLCVVLKSLSLTLNLLCLQYTVSCDLVKLLPTVAFHLGGQEYSLTDEDYILWVRTLYVSISHLVVLILE